MCRPIYIIWYLTLAALLTACASDGNKARVKGNFKNVQRAEIYFYSADGVGIGIDTLTVERGDFKGEISVSEPSLYTLLLQNFTEYSLILEPNATITIQGDGQKLAAMTITGTEQNELLTAFRQSVIDKSEAERARIAADFIRQHPQSLAAIAVMRDVFCHQANPNKQLVKELLALLKKNQPKSRALHIVEQTLMPATAIAVGSDLPAFEATTIHGEAVKSTDFSGKPMLIAVAAIWAHNYNEQLRTLHEVKRQAPSDLKILLLSLDTDINRLQQRMQTDSLSAPVICDGKSFQSPLISLFGIRYVSTAILVDRTGRIIARDVEPKQLLSEVRKLK